VRSPISGNRKSRDRESWRIGFGTFLGGNQRSSCGPSHLRRCRVGRLPISGNRGIGDSGAPMARGWALTLRHPEGRESVVIWEEIILTNA
jgi:hypothetical protein